MAYLHKIKVDAGNGRSRLRPYKVFLHRRQFMKKVLVFAMLVSAVGLHFSCSSELELPPAPPDEALHGSSSSGEGGSSSSLAASSSSFGGGSSSSGLVASSSSFGGGGSSSSVIPSSSSVVPSSSSSLPSGTVLCVLSSEVCSPMALIACEGLNGTPVQSCPVSSSSSVILSSSSVIPSSSSVAPSSSSSLPSGAVWCKLPNNTTCVAISQDACNSFGGTSCDESSSSAIPSSSSVAPCTANDNTSTHYCSEGTMKAYGSVTDNGGKTYKTVVINTQTWMAENLNYNPGTGNSACYDDLTSNCTTYGRLYDWSTAKTVCPTGWHLPSDAEWDVLVNYAGGSSTAGGKLKAASSWNENGNGTDQYGFSALPGGYSYSGGFSYVNNDGYWWSATEDDSNYDYAYARRIYHNFSHVNRDYDHKSFLFSVRCVKN